MAKATGYTSPKITASGKGIATLIAKVPTDAFRRMVSTCGLPPADARELFQAFLESKGE